LGGVDGKGGIKMDRHQNKINPLEYSAAISAICEEN
jgi:hypothetical protein